MIYTSNLVIGLEKGLDDPAFLKRAADETGTGVELFLHTHDTAYLRNMEKAALCVSNGSDAAQSAYGVSYPSEGDSGG